MPTSGRKRIRGASLITFRSNDGALGSAALPSRAENGSGNDGSGDNSFPPHFTGQRTGSTSTAFLRKNSTRAVADSSEIRLGPSSAAPPPPVVVAHGCLLIPAVVAVWWFWTKRATRKACRQSQRAISTVLNRRRDPSSSSTYHEKASPVRPLSSCGAGVASTTDGTGTYPGASSSLSPTTVTSRDNDGRPVMDDPDDQDVYQSWDQVVAKNQAALGYCTPRLVRWIRGPSELQNAHRHYQQKRTRTTRNRSLEPTLLLRRRMMTTAADPPPQRSSTSPPSPPEGHQDAQWVCTEEEDEDMFSRNWDYIQDLTDIELCSMGSVRLGASQDDDGDDNATLDSVEVIASSTRYRELL